MGKPGAYLVYERCEHSVRTPEESLRDFDEIAIRRDADTLREQASRCMNCGVAFCQTGIAFGHARPSGCPLHNLIPEFNDLVYRGRMDEAHERLALTNPFADFTGRVCPAPCEAACNLGLNFEATTIRDNERAIADYAWEREEGPVTYSAPAADAPSVAVVGSGPSGLAVAAGLGARGIRATVFERDERPGGLLTFGIPNMKLPKEVVARRLNLMEDAGCTFRLSTDVTDPGVAAGIADEFDAVVLATGARRARGLTCEGKDLEGVVFALDYLSEATRALLEGREAKITASGLNVIVIGGGDTGTDCVATAVRQGAKSVRQFEFLPEPSHERTSSNPWPEWPNRRKDDYGQIEAASVYGRDPRTWAIETLEVKGEDGHVRCVSVCDLDWRGGRPSRLVETVRDIECDLILLAMGFSGPERAIFDTFGVTVADDARGLPLVGEGTHLTTASGDTPVFVAGDCKGGSSLVVSAIADGLACATEVADFLEGGRL